MDMNRITQDVACDLQTSGSELPIHVTPIHPGEHDILTRSIYALFNRSIKSWPMEQKSARDNNHNFETPWLQLFQASCTCRPRWSGQEALQDFLVMWNKAKLGRWFRTYVRELQ